jgi:hypothetical protein
MTASSDTVDHAGSRHTESSKGATPRLAGILTGVRLLTRDGYRPVETLRRGDLVATLLGRGPMFAPIAWIGRRTGRPAGGPQPHTIAPVRIRRHAIGDGMPARDVRLAADHALYLDGTLYLAGQLVNGASILHEPGMPAADYWGVQLERHDIVVADNLAIESLLPASAAAYVPVTSKPSTALDRRARVGDETPVPDMASHLPWFRRWVVAGARPLPANPSPMPDQPADQSEGDTLDLEAEVRQSLHDLSDLARQHAVRLEIAVQPRLRLRLDRPTFHAMAGAMLRHAIRASSGGRVLLGATVQAGWLQLIVIDESTVPPPVRADDLSGVRSAAALQGGRLDVVHRPNEGTTMMLRLSVGASAP